MAGQAVLIGVGVGDGSASILAASLTWIFKGTLYLNIPFLLFLRLTYSVVL